MSSASQPASLTGSRWTVRAADAQLVQELARELSIAPLTARVLVCRGIAGSKEAGRFLSYDLGTLHDPNALPDMDRALLLLDQALTRGSRIRIHGDYDVDGVCATALLVRALRGLGGNVDWYIPHRLDEGYGVNEEAVRQASEEGISLLITVDCGTSAVDQVALARQLGMEVIVTDHHRTGEALPDAPVLNPWRPDSLYPFKELAGVGVAFKLLSALARARELPEGAELRFLDLVCLGTVGDVVPLLDENRLFVHHGLRQLPASRKVGIAALLEAAGVSGRIGSRQVAFALAPRINAVGRMEHAQAAVELLLTKDPQQARSLAAQLSEQNDRRREEEHQIFLQADQRVAEEVDLGRDRVIVLDSEGWHPGVIGIVASRLVERYHRPVLLIAVSDGVGKGSGRSIDAFNLWAGLRQCSSLLTRFGGHHYAAGFAISADRIPSLRARINELAAACLTPDDLVRTITLDGEADAAELSLESVSELNRLAPFGRGNPLPLFVIRGLQVGEVNTVGNDSHLAMRLLPRPPLASPTPSVGAIWFRAGHLASQVPVGARVDVCCRPRPDEWNGNIRVRLYVEDMALQER